MVPSHPLSVIAMLLFLWMTSSVVGAQAPAAAARISKRSPESEAAPQPSPIDTLPHPTYDTMDPQGVVSDEGRLIRMLLERYRNTSPLARPVVNSSDPVRVEFRLSLQKIIDFDEKNQVLTTYLWKDYRWRDEFLKWDPADFGGLKKTRIPPSHIWTPDIILYNNIGPSQGNFGEGGPPVSLHSDGFIIWVPPAIQQTSCLVDPTTFPYDEQTCDLKYGSWSYDMQEVDLVFLEDLTKFDLTEYVNNTEWDIVKNEATRHDLKYECCEELYSDLTYELVLRRRPAFFARFMLLPTILLSLMVLFIFWIPPQRPDRTGLGMSLFTSFMLLLLLVVDSTPPTDSSKLGAFCCYNIIGVSTATFLSILVVNIALRKEPMPRGLQAIVDKLSRILCFCPAMPARSGLRRKQDYQHSKNSVENPQLMNSKQQEAHEEQARAMAAANSNSEKDWITLAISMDRIIFVLYFIYFVAVVILTFPFPLYGYDGHTRWF